MGEVIPFRRKVETDQEEQEQGIDNPDLKGIGTMQGQDGREFVFDVNQAMRPEGAKLFQASNEFLEDERKASLQPVDDEQDPGQ